MYDLCDEQMAAVTGASVGAWSEVNRPIGRQVLPGWLLGAHVDWMEGCANAPGVMLKVRGDVFSWDEQRWQREGNGCYITRHADGRARVLYHRGAISEAGVWRVFVGAKPFTYQWSVASQRAGESLLAAAQREGEAHLSSIAEHRKRYGDHFTTMHSHPFEPSDLRLEVKVVRVTDAQQGFGGAHYDLTMQDGSDLILRGPWHGGAPSGFVEVTAHDTTSRYAAPDRWQRRKPWHKRAGLYITEDLFLRALSHFAPHAHIARVHHSYGWRIEPFRGQWCAPKSVIYDVEHRRASLKQPAGEFWRVYWDRSERYCGEPCPPTPPYGLAAD